MMMKNVKASKSANGKKGETQTAVGGCLDLDSYSDSDSEGLPNLVEAVQTRPVQARPEHEPETEAVPDFPSFGL